MTAFLDETEDPPPRRGRKPKYPWRDMAVGAVFYITKPPKSIYRNIWIAGERCGAKFRSRTILRQGEVVLRVRRIA